MVGRQTTNGAQSLMEKRNQDTPMRRERERERSRYGKSAVGRKRRNPDRERH